MMDKESTNRLVELTYDLSDIKRDYFRQKVYHTQPAHEGQVLEAIMEGMKVARSITIELTDAVLHDDIIEELKWLTYYHFNAHIIVKNESLLEKYRSCSKNIMISHDLTHNLMIIRFDNREEIYVMDGKLRKAQILIKNTGLQTEIFCWDRSIKQGVIYTTVLDAPLKDASILKDIQYGYMAHVSAHQSELLAQCLAKGLTYVLVDHDVDQNKVYFIIDQELFEVVMVRRTILLTDCHASTNDVIFYEYHDQLDDQELYVIKQQHICMLQHGQTKRLFHQEKKQSFESYEKEIIETNIEQLIQEHIDYDRLEIMIEIIPPYISDFPLYKPSPRYEQAKKAFLEIKSIINQWSPPTWKSKTENGLAATYHNIRTVFNDGKNYKSIESIINIQASLCNHKELTRKLKAMFVSDMKRHYHHSFHNHKKTNDQIQSLEEKRARIQKQKEKLGDTAFRHKINAIQQEIKMMKTMMQDASQSSVTDETLNRIFDQHLSKTRPQSKAATSTLSRVMDVSLVEDITLEYQSALLEYVDHLLALQTLLEAVVDQMKTLDLPTVGILYQHRDKHMLAIHDEVETDRAKMIAKHYDANICMIKGGKHEHETHICH